MSRWQVARHQVAISGRVTGAQDNKPIRDAEIVITDMPVAFKARLRGADNSPNKTRTRPDGFFYFLDLPDGKYTLMASVPRLGKRCGVVRETASVSRDAQGTLKSSFVAYALNSTTISGKVTGAGQKAGVVMAEIRIKGSGERAFSDARGQYMLSGIEPGSRTVVIVAQGYRSVAQAVMLKEPGEVQTLNFNLVRESG